ncbi:1-hydroxycarotenoid 3,4-desaturase CrtD [Marivirga harenae]|uniref:1-hydroxycarotenoid 3,4-desaturase CrtD n=1 Tax=Marivirga harenae TaxID=2010992 RepID=UPI0026DFD9C8|nr:1-hydroxycarotenoid 3,4-desaturase CrtD [Marivirga harenae]WKV13543.1 phytoene desaturase family protein [Marivirga harenae]|tara:strand:+ start:181336 stop:182799 length:1464 start_codon:yes stop_codon:yes gene_type:complete
MKAVIVGAGIGGLATSIRLAKKGYEVEVFEQNNYLGGKLSVFEQEGFRFDAGPSLFTLPELVDDLVALQSEESTIKFPYKKLDESCRYFWEDGKRLTAYTSPKKFALEVEQVLGVPVKVVTDYIKNAEFKYEKSAKIFLEKSLHKRSTFLSKEILPALLSIYKFGLFESMNQVNESKLKHPKLVQLFNRFATYNGSSPYQAPGILTSIANLELNRGTFYPENGMYQITHTLAQVAESLGVKIHFNAGVEKILVENKVAKGIVVNGKISSADLVVSNMDIYPTYKKLLSDQKQPENILNQERSSSALIFYWGIEKEFGELGLHNIFFSDDYHQEFHNIFKTKTIAPDPTIYVNITSKHTPSDAPDGMENWFVMVNVPSNSGQDWDQLIPEIKKSVLKKLKRMLGIDIAQYIKTESILEPRTIESKTSSYQGALYGSSSNNRYSAFLRHPNFHPKIKGLYFSGGSVHPGGGIPLCLLSAKIIDDLSPSV